MLSHFSIPQTAVNSAIKLTFPNPDMRTELYYTGEFTTSGSRPFGINRLLDKC